MSASSGGRRSPRVLAALCYAVPFVAAIVMLLRERRNRFIRVHAAQSIIFFAIILFAQTLLFIALIAIGGSISALPATALVGLLFYMVFALIAVFGFIIWLRLIADAMAGRHTRFPVLGSASLWLEGALAQAQRLLRLPHSSRAKE